MIYANPKCLAVALAVAGLSATASAQDVFHVATAQDLQNALTTAAGDGADNIIFVTNGYYETSSTLTYNSADNNSLTIEPEPNMVSTNITLDSLGGGRFMNIALNGSLGNVTVSGLTFRRNCGNSSIGALRIAGATGGNIMVSDCQFQSETNDEGMGLEIAAGQNLTIFNCNFVGYNSYGGNSEPNGDGIYVSGVSGTNALYNNTISGNYEGFGAYILAGAVLTVTNNLFAANSYSGLYFNPSPGSDIAQATVQGNVFNGNADAGADIGNFDTLNLGQNLFEENSGYEAGGAEVSGFNLTAVGNTFTGNYGYYGAGGLYSSSYTNIVSGNTFSWNSAYFYEGGVSGGGVEIDGYGPILLAGNTFTGNSVDGAGSENGGGAYLTAGYGDIIVSNNVFDANQAVNGQGGGVCVQNYNFLTLLDNTFTGNSCDGNYYGGALYVYGGTPTITGNTFEQNSSADGGGAIAANNVGYAIITDNLIANNSQSGGGASGGGILVIPTSSLYMINNTIFGNTSGGSGGGAAFQLGSGTTQLLYVFNNIIWGNSATVTGGGQDVAISGSGYQSQLLYNDVNDVAGVWTIAQNQLNQDPKFFNSVAGDFHFPESSPCANAGTNGAPAQPLTDLDGNVRTNLLGIDLGCYQFNNTAPHPADTNGVYTITADEYNAYAAAWKSGQSWTNFTSGPNPIPIPANYLTRAGYLMTNGGAYTNDGTARPTNWKLAQ